MELFEIKLKCVERENNETGEKFLSYSTYTKDNSRIDVRFTKEVLNKPNHACIILVQEGKIWIDTKKRFPVCWVSEINEIKEYEFKQNVSDYFSTTEK